MCWQKLKECLCCPKLCSFAKCKINFAELWLMPASVLVMRLWLADIFWKSGLTKIYTDTAFGFIPYFGVTDTTYFLFEEEYGMPFPEVSAWASTLVELGAPILLLFGFGARFAAVALLIMTLTIHFTYIADPSHYMWMMFSAIILSYGAGKFSVDHWIRNKCNGCKEC